MRMPPNLRKSSTFVQLMYFARSLALRSFSSESMKYNPRLDGERHAWLIDAREAEELVALEPSTIRLPRPVGVETSDIIIPPESEEVPDTVARRTVLLMRVSTMAPGVEVDELGVVDSFATPWYCIAIWMSM